MQIINTAHNLALKCASDAPLLVCEFTCDNCDKQGASRAQGWPKISSGQLVSSHCRHYHLAMTTTTTMTKPVPCAFNCVALILVRVVVVVIFPQMVCLDCQSWGPKDATIVELIIRGKGTMIHHYNASFICPQCCCCRFRRATRTQTTSEWPPAMIINNVFHFISNLNQQTTIGWAPIVLGWWWSSSLSLSGHTKCNHYESCM